MANDRRRQKKLEKKKKDRAEKQRQLAAQPSTASRHGLVQLASRRPFGPAYVSAGWDNLADPELVTVVVTRVLPDGLLLPVVALVDRTCLGVKSGFVTKAAARGELPQLLAKLFQMHEGLHEVEVLDAQSILFHALDYAAALGFRPDPDFPLAMVEPRPAVLRDTPWASAPKPIYISGPDDDAGAVLAQLSRKRGDRDFELTTGLGSGGPGLLGDADVEDDAQE